MYRRSIPGAPSFFFNDTATTEIYTLSLHDALPICNHPLDEEFRRWYKENYEEIWEWVRHNFTGHDYDFIGKTLQEATDRKSTRLNSSHANISYAVFCLKKKIIQSIKLNGQRPTEIP